MSASWSGCLLLPLLPVVLHWHVEPLACFTSPFSSNPMACFLLTDVLRAFQVLGCFHVPPPQLFEQPCMLPGLHSCFLEHQGSCLLLFPFLTSIPKLLLFFILVYFFPVSLMVVLGPFPSFISSLWGPNPLRKLLSLQSHITSFSNTTLNLPLAILLYRCALGPPHSIWKLVFSRAQNAAQWQQK